MLYCGNRGYSVRYRYRYLALDTEVESYTELEGNKELFSVQKMHKTLGSALLAAKDCKKD